MIQHVRHVRMSGDLNNNKMERMNGEVREREKVMRGLKRPDTPILTGYQMFHNYIRPHEGLNGRTPAQLLCWFHSTFLRLTSQRPPHLSSRS
jgi:hypothetical protein